MRLRHQIGGGRGVRHFQKRGRDPSGHGRDSKRQKPTDDDRGSDGWPADRPKFLQFVPTPPYILEEEKKK